MRELTKYQILYSEITGKVSLKSQILRKRKNRVEKKNYKVEKNFKGELKKNYVSRILKNDLKTDGFPFWTSDQIFFPSTRKYAILLLAIFYPKRRNF